jgi:hypothetical protein
MRPTHRRQILAAVRRGAIAAAAALASSAGTAQPISAAPAPTAPSFRQAPAAAVRLVAPAPGEPWLAGASAELAWEPLAGFGRLPRVEEWEAFLSLDGGAHYTVRLTPHLDADLRQASIRIPDLPTSDARLLLRFGDERRQEAWLELPRRLTIVLPGPLAPIMPGTGAAGAAAAVLAALDLPAAGFRRAAAPGEAPLPGRPGVTVWQEGTRRGAATRQVVATQLAALAAPPLPEIGNDPVGGIAAEAPPDGPAAALLSGARAGGSRPPNAHPGLRPNLPLRSLDLLTRNRRRNE